MGVFTRHDSPWYWLYLERPGQQGIRERSAIRNTPENRALAQEAYEARMAEIGRGVYVHSPITPLKRARAPRADTSGWCYIYFVSDGQLIKIGRAVNVQARLRAMQTSHPRPLTLLAVLGAHVSVERLLHRHFAFCRHDYGEWFKPCEELIGLIEKIEKGRDPIPLLLRRSRSVPATFASLRKEAKTLGKTAAN